MGYLGKFLGVDLAAGRRLGTNLAPRVLPYSTGLLTFVNASERYILAGGSMTGPFAANTPATRVIGGKNFIQLEASRSTLNTRSEAADHGDWSKTRVTVDPNTHVSPVATTTGDFLEEDVVNNDHYMRRDHAGILIGEVIVVSLFVRPVDRERFYLEHEGLATGTCGIRYDFPTKAIYTVTGTLDWYRAEECGDWFFLEIGKTAIANDTARIFYWLVDAAGNLSYQGVAGKGVAVWGMNNIENLPYSTSYIQAAAATTRNKDEAEFSIAAVPANHWARTSFFVRLIMHQSSSTTLAAAGTTPYIIEFEAAAATISLYIDAADLKFKWKSSAPAALGESAAASWSIGDIIDLEFVFDNGANSTLKVTGGGLAATYTGTSTAAADGAVHIGMDAAQGNHADIMLISELERL
jgi:hypothetical protein